MNVEYFAFFPQSFHCVLFVRGETGSLAEKKYCPTRACNSSDNSKTLMHPQVLEKISVGDGGRRKKKKNKPSLHFPFLVCALNSYPISTSHSTDSFLLFSLFSLSLSTRHTNYPSSPITSRANSRNAFSPTPCRILPFSNRSKRTVCRERYSISGPPSLACPSD